MKNNHAARDSRLYTDLHEIRELYVGAQPLNTGLVLRHGRMVGNFGGGPRNSGVLGMSFLKGAAERAATINVS